MAHSLTQPQPKLLGLYQRSAAFVKASSRDGAVISSLVVRLVSAVAGAVAAVFVVRYLTLEAQGYWYTFTSVLATATFAEMGLGQVLMRFASAEIGGFEKGEPSASLRLRSLFRLTVYWGIGLSVSVGVISFLVGYWIMRHGNVNWEKPAWQWAWAMACIGAPAGILVALLNGFFDGCQEISRSNWRRSASATGTLASTWGCFATGGGLLTFGVSRIFGVLIAAIMMGWHHGRLMLRLATGFRSNRAVNWRQEIWPLQSRYALSWLSGPITFGLFTPILFIACSPAEAGRFGLSVTVASVISTFSAVWIAARQPFLARLLAEERKAEFLRLQRTTLRACVLSVVLSSSALVVVYAGCALLRPELLLRVLSLPGLLCLIGVQACAVTLHFVTGVVRSFGEEPFVGLVWGQALLTLILLYPLARWLQGTGAALAYVISQMATVPLLIAIYRRYLARLRHQPSPA